MRTRKWFTIIELLVVVSIIALLVGILLPAIGKAREQANLTRSQANLRQIAIAAQTYGAEFADRQLTLIDDYIASYGDDAQSAIANFGAAVGPVGWNELGLDQNGTLWILVPAHITLVPFNWSSDFGSFRTDQLPPVQPVSGRSFHRSGVLRTQGPLL